MNDYSEFDVSRELLSEARILGKTVDEDTALGTLTQNPHSKLELFAINDKEVDIILKENISLQERIATSYLDAEKFSDKLAIINPNVVHSDELDVKEGKVYYDSTQGFLKAEPTKEGLSKLVYWLKTYPQKFKSCFIKFIRGDEAIKAQVVKDGGNTYSDENKRGKGIGQDSKPENILLKYIGPSGQMVPGLNRSYIKGTKVEVPAEMADQLRQTKLFEEIEMEENRMREDFSEWDVSDDNLKKEVLQEGGHRVKIPEEDKERIVHLICLIKDPQKRLSEWNDILLRIQERNAKDAAKAEKKAAAISIKESIDKTEDDMLDCIDAAYGKFGDKVDELITEYGGNLPDSDTWCEGVEDIEGLYYKVRDVVKKQATWDPVTYKSWGGTEYLRNIWDLEWDKAGKTLINARYR